MGENWQAKIEATNSIILPFTTASFHCDTTPFCRPLFKRPTLSRLNAAVDWQRCCLSPAILGAIIAWPPVRFRAAKCWSGKFRSCCSRSRSAARKRGARCELAWGRRNERRVAPLRAALGRGHGVDRGERRNRGRERRTAATSCARSQRFIATRPALSSPDAAPPRPYPLGSRRRYAGAYRN